jgi:ABC-type branched-subunit amino acid transport system permease subunit
MELVGGVVVILTLAVTLYLLAFWLGLAAIIVLSAIVTLGIPLIAGITISPDLGITLFMIEAVLIGAILGYNQFSKGRIKKWDERMPKREKKDKNS